MTELKEIGIIEYQSVKPSLNAKASGRHVASYFKVKPESATAPRLNTKLIKMPEGVL